MILSILAIVLCVINMYLLYKLNKSHNNLSLKTNDLLLKTNDLNKSMSNITDWIEYYKKNIEKKIKYFTKVLDKKFNKNV